MRASSRLVQLQHQSKKLTVARNHLSALLLCFLSGGLAQAQQPTDAVKQNEAINPGQEWSHVGLLRARDLTPFGLLRLDMLPARTADGEAGTWGFELQYAYQSTFVMSRNVRTLLENRGIGRQPLRPEDVNAILNFPDDAYYVDGEVGLADLIVQRHLSPYWSAYLTVPYIRYGRGFFDQLIEGFHDAIGVGQMGRDLVARNQFQFVYRIGDARIAQLSRETSEGFGDPVLGIRYSLPGPRLGWDVVAEFAAKIAVDGERLLLSTGKNDYGFQLTLQRRLGSTGRHSIYLAASGVYYQGDGVTSGPELIPTAIAGYSLGLTPRTSVIVQGYISKSAVQDSTLDELTAAKNQYSAGIQTRSRNFLISLAFTENAASFENTPDFGVQLGVAYLPRAQ